MSSVEEFTSVDSAYGCCTFRGSVAALAAETGKLLWRAHTITAEPAPTQKNARGVQRFGPAGGAVWSAPTIDLLRRRIYVTTGNRYADPPADGGNAIIAFALDRASASGCRKRQRLTRTPWPATWRLLAPATALRQWVRTTTLVPDPRVQPGTVGGGDRNSGHRFLGRRRRSLARLRRGYRPHRLGRRYPRGTHRTVIGVAGQGGSLDGPGPIVVDGTLYVGSGYGLYGGMPGNVLLAYFVDGK